MAMTGFDGFLSAGQSNQQFSYKKTTSRTTVANEWFSLWDVAGDPGAGTLAASGGVAGQLYTASTAGAKSLTTFGGGNTGYLGPMTFGSNVTGRHMLVDRIWGVNVGFTAATTTISGAASYSGRVINSDYSSTSLWIEITTAFVAGNNWTATITYTNGAGTGSRSTSYSIANVTAATIGRMQQIPLQAGDTGIQSIQSVVVTNGVTAMTAGALNVLVLRYLWTDRIIATNWGMLAGLDKIGAVVIPQTACLQMIVSEDGTTSGLPEMYLSVFNI
jgi:hypothetical protein